MGLGSAAARGLAPIARRTAPKFTSGYVREILELAIDGVGPFRGAVRAADAKLVSADGDIEAAIKALGDAHVRMAGVQGFVTNVGGLVTLALSIPANVTGLALLQCHLVAGVAHLRGYDLADPRVRNAVLVCLLGEDHVKSLVKKKQLPGGPMLLATSPVHDPKLDEMIGSHVTTELLGKVGGRRAVIFVGRRVPLLGGGVGAVADAMSTRSIAAYATAELRERRNGATPAPT